MKTVNAPRIPAFSPTQTLRSRPPRRPRATSYAVKLETREVTPITSDEFSLRADLAPDGRSIVVPLRREEKREAVPVRSRAEGAPAAHLARTTMPRRGFTTRRRWSSRQPPPILRSHRFPRWRRTPASTTLWTLNLKTGELRSNTDTPHGKRSPVVVNTEKRAAGRPSSSYYKGEYGLNTIDLTRPITTRHQLTRARPARIIDFQAPLSHRSYAKNVRKKGTFEKLFLDGVPRSPWGSRAAAMSTAAATAISFADVLGDQRFDIYAASVLQYRTIAGRGSTSPALPVGAAGLLADHLLLRPLRQRPLRLYLQRLYRSDMSLSRARSTAAAATESTARHVPPAGSLGRRDALQGVVRRHRSGGLLTAVPAAGVRHAALPERHESFRSRCPFVQETTIFREFGPLSGTPCGWPSSTRPRSASRSHARPSTSICGTTSGWRKRLAGPAGGRLQELGPEPDVHLFRRELRDARVRLPRIPRSERRLCQRGAAVPHRARDGDTDWRAGRHSGVLFANIGGAWFNASGYTFATTKESTYKPIVDLDYDLLTGIAVPGVRGRVSDIGLPAGGWQGVVRHWVRDLRLGFPIHFDWSWRTLFTGTGRTCSSTSTAAATGSAKLASSCGSATISRLPSAAPRSAAGPDPRGTC